MYDGLISVHGWYIAYDHFAFLFSDLIFLSLPVVFSRAFIT